MTAIFSALGITILIVGAQVLWKLGAAAQINDFQSFWLALKSPLVILGAILYLIATIIWLIILSRYPYHLIYPLLSLSFVLALIASRFILQETVPWLSWLGVILICLGIIIISLGFKFK